MNVCICVTIDTIVHSLCIYISENIEPNAYVCILYICICKYVYMRVYMGLWWVVWSGHHHAIGWPRPQGRLYRPWPSDDVMGCCMIASPVGVCRRKGAFVLASSTAPYLTLNLLIHRRFCSGVRVGERFTDRDADRDADRDIQTEG